MSADVPDRIARALHGKGDKANAIENQTAEFQAGYAEGLTNQAANGLAAITAEWRRRGSPDELTDDFREWKRGYWAARMQRAWMHANSTP